MSFARFVRAQNSATMPSRSSAGGVDDARAGRAMRKQGLRISEPA